jgi:hypothetical protein
MSSSHHARLYFLLLGYRENRPFWMSYLHFFAFSLSDKVLFYFPSLTKESARDSNCHIWAVIRTLMGAETRLRHYVNWFLKYSQQTKSNTQTHVIKFDENPLSGSPAIHYECRSTDGEYLARIRTCKKLNKAHSWWQETERCRTNTYKWQICPNSAPLFVRKDEDGHANVG